MRLFTKKMMVFAGLCGVGPVLAEQGLYPVQLLCTKPASGSYPAVSYDYVPCDELPAALHTIPLSFGKKSVLVLSKNAAAVCKIFEKKLEQRQDAAARFEHPTRFKSFVVEVVFGQAPLKNKKQEPILVRIHGTQGMVDDDILSFVKTAFFVSKKGPRKGLILGTAALGLGVAFSVYGVQNELLFFPSFSADLDENQEAPERRVGGRGSRGLFEDRVKGWFRSPERAQSSFVDRERVVASPARVLHFSGESLTYRGNSTSDIDWGDVILMEYQSFMAFSGLVKAQRVRCVDKPTRETENKFYIFLYGDKRHANAAPGWAQALHERVILRSDATFCYCFLGGDEVPQVAPGVDFFSFYDQAFNSKAPRKSRPQIVSNKL